MAANIATRGTSSNTNTATTLVKYAGMHQKPCVMIRANEGGSMLQGMIDAWCEVVG